MNIAEFICSGYGMGKGLLIFVLGAHSLNCKSTTWLPLTLDIPTSRLANGCAANSALVKIEKYTGPALELTAFIPPKNG